MQDDPLPAPLLHPYPAPPAYYYNLGGVLGLDTAAAVPPLTPAPPSRTDAPLRMHLEAAQQGISSPHDHPVSSADGFSADGFVYARSTSVTHATSIYDQRQQPDSLAPHPPQSHSVTLSWTQ
ncbi:hypothetical protein AURDEDRAFT_178520 [Auricularia subglabra TFB-10046 SS5]|uniref:Uncharacterized protein n=1 Tax=Auricularia subglabra (strain TFB-10046 / SS5) TaxID=717982 RepID=J0WKV8_AURST|nr:hypothetical protein AURDEDRAFT_178520 [Auricularia subglabra TFB-10046 SS5]